MIRKLFLIGLVCLMWLTCIANVWADDDQPVLPQVSFGLNADKWLTSTTANVTVAVHALLTQEQLASAQQDILQALQKISNQGTWYIVQMQRTRNQADLEQLDVTAEARLPNNAITDLRSKAKSVSKQGQTYEISNIDYSPTQAELTTAQADLRNQIYQLAQGELERLNQVFPEQKYALFTINFNGLVTPQAMEQRTMMVQTDGNNPAPAPAAVSANVSQHLTLSAQVTLSAKPLK